MVTAEAVESACRELRNSVIFRVKSITYLLTASSVTLYLVGIFFGGGNQFRYPPYAYYFVAAGLLAVVALYSRLFFRVRNESSTKWSEMVLSALVPSANAIICFGSAIPLGIYTIYALADSSALMLAVAIPGAACLLAPTAYPVVAHLASRSRRLTSQAPALTAKEINRLSVEPAEACTMLSKWLQVTLLLFGILICTSCAPTKDKQIIWILSGHAGPVDALVFSPNGKLLASGSRDKTVKLWDLTSGKLKCSMDCGSAVDSVIFSDDGTRLVSGSKDSTIRIWDASTGSLVRALNIHAKSEYEYGVELARSGDKDVIASGTEDAKVKLWDVNTGKVIGSIDAQDFVVGLATSQNGKKLACAGYAVRGSVEVVDLATRKKIFETSSDMDLMSVAVCFCNEDKFLAIREEGTKTHGDEESGKIHFLDADTGKVISEVKTGDSHEFWNNSDRPAPSLTVGPDSKILATGVYSRVVFYDAATGNKLGSYATSPNEKDLVYDVAFSRDGKSVASSMTQSSFLKSNTQIEVRRMPDLGASAD